MKFDSIILDVDGTIWDTTSIVAKAWNCAIDSLFPELPKVTAEILKGQFGKTMDVIGNNLFSSLSKENQKLLLDLCCKEEQLALEKNEENIAYDGVVDTIRTLSNKIPIFIVSNCQSGYIELVIKKIGISDCIKDFECFGNSGLTKDKNISLLAIRNGLKNPVYVGDTQGDFDACKLSGIPFIWASYGFGFLKDLGYYARIDSFRELMSIFSS